MLFKKENIRKVTGIAIVILVLFYLGVGNYKLPLQKETVSLKINSGDSINSITQNLKNNGLIISPLAFKLWLAMNGWLDDLKAGNYTFEGAASTAEVASRIALGKTTPVFKITIPEGLTLKDALQLFQEKGILTATDKFDLSLLTSEERKIHPYLLNWKTVNPEGLIFPDTYFFEENPSSAEILETVLNNFDNKVYKSLESKFEASDFSFRDILIIASLVEKEVVSTEDRRLVAGIILKRLEMNMPLQVDATICYIKRKNGNTLCKLKESDFLVDSPYNTYKYPGLPIGPICNPSLDAIQAVLSPKKSTYLYYLSAAVDSQTIYAKTYEEHLLNKAKYLN
ncbi:MAG: endolytic transglycosylase MltG [Minisyncoccia bacterium]